MASRVEPHQQRNIRHRTERRTARSFLARKTASARVSSALSFLTYGPVASLFFPEFRGITFSCLSIFRSSLYLSISLTAHLLCFRRAQRIHPQLYTDRYIYMYIYIARYSEPKESIKSLFPSALKEISLRCGKSNTARLVTNFCNAYTRANYIAEKKLCTCVLRNVGAYKQFKRVLSDLRGNRMR